MAIGRVFTAALGDGSALFIDYQSQHPLLKLEAHCGIVSQVRFSNPLINALCKAESSSCSSVSDDSKKAGDDDLSLEESKKITLSSASIVDLDSRVVTCGTDCHLKLWSLPKTVYNGLDPAASNNNREKEKYKKKSSKKKKDIVKEVSDETAVSGVDTTLTPILLLDIEHNSKPNWFSLSSINSGCIIVADQSNDIHVYKGIAR
jgi:hypothetical protein